MKGLDLLEKYGIRENSRNGPVIVSPEPVTTVFSKPHESMVFWDRRDTNVAFLIYEALWMMGGCRHVGPLTRYVKRMKTYAESDGELHGAYGDRWRNHFGIDQLMLIQQRLSNNPEDRRSVLTMWDPDMDLLSPKSYQPKDLPCNMIATFQIHNNALDMTVFNRSNDIIWGTYFANAFHFGMLHELMAGWCMKDLGKYRQVSVNFHAYVDIYEKLMEPAVIVSDPYKSNWVHTEDSLYEMATYDAPQIFERAARVRDYADSGMWPKFEETEHPEWFLSANKVLQAHHVHKSGNTKKALEIIGDGKHHWIVAMRQWLTRRLDR